MEKCHAELKGDCLNKVYKVKCSKKLIVFTILCLTIFGCGIFGGCYTFSLIKLIKNVDLTGDLYSGMIFVCVLSFVLLIVIIFAIIYCIKKYKCITDYYMQDRMIRKKGEKILFEIEYKNIVSVRQAYLGTLLLICKEPIYYKGTKKKFRTLVEHYRKEDIYRIKRIIGNGNYNLTVN